MRKLVGLGVLAVMAVACADELAEGAGEMLVGAGQVIADAGAALSDAGSDVVSAQDDAGAGDKPAAPVSETFEVKCDQRHERTLTVDDGDNEPQGSVRYTRVTANYYATLRVDTEGLSGVDALACDVEAIGAPKVVVNECARPGRTCVGSDAPPESTRCDSLGASVGEGFVRVKCGEWYRATSIRGGLVELPTGESGERYKTVRFTVRY